jgi:leader peptidase (prepilin peptidase) / N-methyltransferase
MSTTAAAAGVGTSAGLVAWWQWRIALAAIAPRWYAAALPLVAGAGCVGIWCTTSSRAHAIVALHLVVVVLPLAVGDSLNGLLPRTQVHASYVPTALLVGITHGLSPTDTTLLGALIGAAAVWALFLGMALCGGLGFGDVRLAPVLGAHLGSCDTVTLITGICTAFVFGALVTSALAAAGLLRDDKRIPFGPALLCGAIAAIIA